MVVTSAALQAARMLAAPAVKLIIAGTRPARHHAEDRHHRAVRVRQHHAERLAFAGERHQLLAEHGGAEQQALVAERAGHRILDRDALPAVHFAGLDRRVEHGAIGRRGAEHEVGHDLVQRRARGLAAVAAFQLVGDRELHRLEHRDGHLGKPAAVHLAARQARERRRLEPFDAHRHHHRARLVGDQADAVIDLHQAAGDGDAPFGEDHQRLAALHRVDQRARRHRLATDRAASRA